MGINPEIVTEAIRKMGWHDIVVCLVCDAQAIGKGVAAALDEAGWVLVAKEPSREVIQADPGR